MKTIIILLLCGQITQAAISGLAVWEVRTDGDNTNGGAFVTGASGTDWSQQAAAQYSVTDGVTAGTTTITSATASFGTDVVGNLIYISGGTGPVTATRRQITARTNATTITVDATVTASTGVTLKIGGALVDVQTGLTAMNITGQTLYIRGGTYSIGTGLTVAASGSFYKVYGYGTVRGDSGKPIIKATAAITVLNTGGAGVNGYFWSNLVLDGDSVATLGVSGGGTSAKLSMNNCVVKNINGNGISSTTLSNIKKCEINNCVGGINLAGSGTTPHWIEGCYLHDNTSYGIIVGNRMMIKDCLIANNSGATTDGISCTSINTAPYVIGCTIYGNGRHGIGITHAQGHTRMPVVFNCLLVNNAGYGISLAGITSPAGGNTIPTFLNNAYYGNTSGARQNFNAEDGAVTLGGDPFTNAVGGDFSLNAGPGTDAKNVGYPSTIGSTTRSYPDIGAVETYNPPIGGTKVGGGSLKTKVGGL